MARDQGACSRDLAREAAGGALTVLEMGRGQRRGGSCARDHMGVRRGAERRLWLVVALTLARHQFVVGMGAGE